MQISQWDCFLFLFLPSLFSVTMIGSCLLFSLTVHGFLPPFCYLHSFLKFFNFGYCIFQFGNFHVVLPYIFCFFAETFSLSFVSSIFELLTETFLWCLFGNVCQIIVTSLSCQRWNLLVVSLHSFEIFLVLGVMVVFS